MDIHVKTEYRDNCINRRGSSTLRLLCALLFLFITAEARGQSPLKIQSFGSDLGGTLLTSGMFSNPVSGQYRFFAVHDINETFSGELNLGLSFLADPVQRSRMYDLEYRVQYPLNVSFLNGPSSLEGRFRSHLYMGVGVGRFQRLNVEVQKDPLLRESEKISNSSIWNNGSGWLPRLSAGIGTRFRLDESTSLRLTTGYHLLAGKSIVKDRSGPEGYMGATLGLSFRPFGQDWDNDRLSTSREMRQVFTSPENPDSDGDGLMDGEEYYHYRTNPLQRDTDGDGLTDGQEVLTYKTNPLLIDTDGGLVADGEEVYKGLNPLNRHDDGSVESQYFADALVPVAADVRIYRSIDPIQYETLRYRLGSEDKEGLEEILALLQSDSNVNVKVSGFADRKGNEIMNRTLSNMRSWSVMEYLLQQGISSDRLLAEGYGEEYPVDPAHTSSAYAVNRRAEIYMGYRFDREATRTVSPSQAIPVQEKKGGYLIAPSEIKFENYSDRLLKVAKQRLKGLAEFLASDNELRVLVSGTGDINGGSELNKMLGEARAVSVVRFLLDHGIAWTQLEVATSPLPGQPNQTVAVRALKPGIPASRENR